MAIQWKKQQQTRQLDNMNYKEKQNDYKETII